MKLSLKLMIAVTLCALDLSVGWAQRQYPGSPGLPEDVVWMREIYRTLDLTKDTNGALYYPVEPQGNKMNLFATVFRLLAQKKIPAYEYQLDGTERFQKDAEVTFRDVLDRFQIYYELKKVANRRDSVLSISNSDIPSADVLSYFVKEVWYFDQRTSTYGSVITAICPVLHRSEEFSSEKVKLPMFWVNYKDLVPYLTQTKVSVSNYNNAANSTWDDSVAPDHIREPLISTPIKFLSGNNRPSPTVYSPRPQPNSKTMGRSFPKNDSFHFPFISKGTLSTAE